MSVSDGHVVRRSLLLIAICGLFAFCVGRDVDVDADASEKAFCDEKSPIAGEPTKTRGNLITNQSLAELSGKKSQCLWFVGNNTSNFSVYLIIKSLILSPNDSLILISRASNKTIVSLSGSQTNGIVLTSEKNITIQLMLSNDKFDRSFKVQYSYASFVEQIQNIEEWGRFFFIYGDIQKKPFTKFDLTFAASDNIAGGSKLLIGIEKFDIKGNGFVKFDNAENVNNATKFNATKYPPFILSEPGNVNLDIENIENGTEFRINYEVVTELCSSYTPITADYIDTVKSTIIGLPNVTQLQTLPSFKCFSVYNIQTATNQVAFANVLLSRFQFPNAYDSLLIRDGDSRNSKVIASIIPQNIEDYRQRYLYTSSSKIWVMYNSPVVSNKNESDYKVSIEARSLGGILSNSDPKGTPFNITKGSKTELFPIVFVYEAQNDSMQAVLSMKNNNKLPKANGTYMSVYNSVARNSNPPIISLSSETDPPDFVASDTNQIRVEIFSVENEFNATLTPVKKGCHSTANLVTYVTDSYSLSDDYNAVCSWLIPSKQNNNSQFVLKLSQLNLPEKTDLISLEKFLDTTSTVFKLNGPLSMTAFPDLILDSSFSYTLYTQRQNTTKISSTLSLSGSVTYLNQIENRQTINMTMSGNTTINSTNYPNYYPLGNDLVWQFDGNADQSVLITFNDLQLASSHVLNITDKNRTEWYNRSTTALPPDYIAPLPSFMRFSSDAVESPPYSGRGFSLNLIPVEYGGYVALEPNKSTAIGINKTDGISKCIWIVTVPNQKDGIYILEFNVSSTKPSNQLVIYDSNSIRDSNHIMNMTYFTNASTVPKSSTNTLIIVYSTRDPKTPLTPISFNLTSKPCNYSLCDDRKRCMIKEFWCNGFNDCGDWSDERNCNGSVPLPPPPTPEPQPTPQPRGGVNGWVVLFVICPLCVGLGVIGTTYGPTFMRRFRRGRYTEFQDFSEVS